MTIEAYQRVKKPSLLQTAVNVHRWSQPKLLVLDAWCLPEDSSFRAGT